MNKKSSLKVAAVSTLGISLALTSETGFSQVLEEVLVTARKRQENLQEVPMAISALTAKDIAEAGLMRLQDITQLVPNMTYLEPTTNKFTNITLRGISSGGGLGNDPALGVYIDEVYIGRDSGFNGDLLDIERVEVLKGPQGTLFGRNTTVGAINITTKRPTDEFGGTVVVGVGDYNLKRIGGLVNVPLGDTLAAKLSVVDMDRDGFLDNSFGGTVNTVDYTTGRAQLLWTPSERLDVLLTGSYRESSGNGNSYVTRFQGEPLDKTYDVNIPDPGFEDVEDSMFALHLNYDFSDYTITSITSFQKIEESYRNDSDWTPLDDLTAVDAREMESWSQELRLENSGDSRLEWVIGAYLYHQEFDVFTQSLSGGDTIFAFFGLTDLIGLGLQPSDVIPGLPNGVDISASSVIETDSASLFANATYALNDQWSVTAGVRYSEDDKDLDYEQQADALAAAAGFLPFTLQDKQNDEEVTTTISLNWQPHDNLLAYARYAGGYKAGGFNNSVSTTASLVSFDAETLDSYELGLKSTLLDNSLRVNVAVFRMEYKDKQESRFIAGVGFQQDNAGEAVSDGFEADFEWTPLERWTVYGGVGYAKAEYDDYVVDATTDWSGNTLIRAPEWTANLGVQTDWDFSDYLQGSFRLDYAYQDEFFTQPDNDPFFAADSQGIVNARLGISGGDGSWQFTLWGRNLTDEDNVNELFGASSFVFPLYHYALIAPRTYGAELQFRF